jgi:hypothetical protein
MRMTPSDLDNHGAGTLAHRRRTNAASLARAVSFNEKSRLHDFFQVYSFAHNFTTLYHLRYISSVRPGPVLFIDTLCLPNLSDLFHFYALLRRCLFTILMYRMHE